MQMNLYSKGKINFKTSFKIGNQKIEPFKTSYQLNHTSMKPTDDVNKNERHIEMSKKRMRESRVFQGKNHDTVTSSSLIPETSYQVAVVTEKQELVRQDKCNSK